MDYFISQVSQSPPVIDKHQIESTPVTLGGVILIIAFATSIYAVIRGIAEISTKANQLKNDFERSDLIINNKVDVLSAKLDNTMNTLDSYKTSINRRVYSNELRIQDIELFLAKEHDFTYRRINQVDDDGLPSGIKKS